MKELYDKMSKAMAVFLLYTGERDFMEDEYRKFYAAKILEDIITILREVCRAIPEQYRVVTLMKRIPPDAVRSERLADYILQVYSAFESLENECNAMDNEFAMRYMHMTCLDFESFLRLYINLHLDTGDDYVV